MFWGNKKVELMRHRSPKKVHQDKRKIKFKCSLQVCGLKNNYPFKTGPQSLPTSVCLVVLGSSQNLFAVTFGGFVPPLLLHLLFVCILLSKASWRAQMLPPHILASLMCTPVILWYSQSPQSWAKQVSTVLCFQGCKTQVSHVCMWL